MKRIIVSKISNNPQTEAGIILLVLIKTLYKTDKKTFEGRFLMYTKKYLSFIQEKTTNDLTGERY
jgi:hypothetical protein